MAKWSKCVQFHAHIHTFMHFVSLVNYEKFLMRPERKSNWIKLWFMHWVNIFLKNTKIVWVFTLKKKTNILRSPNNCYYLHDHSNAVKAKFCLEKHSQIIRKLLALHSVSLKYWSLDFSLYKFYHLHLLYFNEKKKNIVPQSLAFKFFYLHSIQPNILIVFW